MTEFEVYWTLLQTICLVFASTAAEHWSPTEKLPAKVVFLCGFCVGGNTTVILEILVRHLAWH